MLKVQVRIVLAYNLEQISYDIVCIFSLCFAVVITLSHMLICVFTNWFHVTKHLTLKFIKSFFIKQLH